MTAPPPIQLDSPRARLHARQMLRDHGISSLIDGDVLWVYDAGGQRLRVDDGQTLVYRDGGFMVGEA